VRNPISALSNELAIPSPLQSLHFNSTSRSILIKRDDLIHPHISGNKWRKLKGYISSFQQEGIVTLGGAFSNHLHATAKLCQYLAIPLVCLVRGKEADIQNPTLSDVKKWGGEIIRIERSQYRLIRDSGYLPLSFQSKYENWKFIPEGGLGPGAFLGVEDLAQEILSQPNDKIDIVVLPVGSGTTAAVLRHFLPSSIRVLGIRVVKDDDLKARLKLNFPSLSQLSELEIIKGFEWKGFGRYDQKLLNWIDDNQSKFDLPLDVIYNSKAFYGLVELVKSNQISRDKNVLYIHTGGLQGNRSVEYFSR